MELGVVVIESETKEMEVVEVERVEDLLCRRRDQQPDHHHEVVAVMVVVPMENHHSYHRRRLCHHVTGVGVEVVKEKVKVTPETDFNNNSTIITAVVGGNSLEYKYVASALHSCPSL